MIKVIQVNRIKYFFMIFFSDEYFEQTYITESILKMHVCTFYLLRQSSEYVLLVHLHSVQIRPANTMCIVL